MRKRGLGRSRSEIGSIRGRHERELAGQEKDVTERVEDREEVHDLHRDLESGGTLEGMEHLQRGMEATKDTARGEYERSEEILAGEQRDTSAFGEELQESADSTGRDLSKVEVAEQRAHTRETQGELGRLEAVLEDDRHFLDGENRGVQERLSASEQIAREMQSRVGRLK